MNILFVSATYPSSDELRTSFAKQGHTVYYICTTNNLIGRLANAINWRVSAKIANTLALRGMLSSLPNDSIDLIWIERGDITPKDFVETAKSKYNAPVICKNNDDPFSKRDGPHRWTNFFESLKLYDLLLFPRQASVSDARANGASNVLLYTLGGPHHKAVLPILWPHSTSEKNLTFIGTYFPERGPWVHQLAEAGIPIKVIGSGWKKYKHFNKIAHIVQNKPLNYSEYIDHINKSYACLCVLSKGNRDDHTSRSVEIPLFGGAMVAQKSNRHMEMYTDNADCLFFDINDIDSQIPLFLSLLNNTNLRNSLAINGHRRALANNHSIERIAATLPELRNFALTPGATPPAL
jgi:spore maturation protein CgeB